MKENDKEAIAKAVRDHVGIREAMAVYAALEVAKALWTTKCTEIYGTMIATKINEEGI